MAQKGPFVYVSKPDGTVELRPVTLGQRQGDAVVVSKGLAGGESVVVTGQLTVKPGAKVRTEPFSAGTTGAGAPGANESASHEYLRAIYTPSGNDGGADRLGHSLWRPGVSRSSR